MKRIHFGIVLHTLHFSVLQQIKASMTREFFSHVGHRSSLKCINSSLFHTRNIFAWCGRTQSANDRRQSVRLRCNDCCETSMNQIFHPPAVALLTEEDACHDNVRMQKAIEAMKEALSAGRGIQLISVRLKAPDDMLSQDGIDLSNSLDQTQDRMAYRERVRIFCDRIRNIVRLHNNNIEGFDTNDHCRVVMNVNEMPSDVDVALDCQLDGLHIKERQRDLIFKVKQLWRTKNEIKEEGGQGTPLIGTSAHSIDSAVKAVSEHEVDYMFVGTCFTTKSHPEKGVNDLEGPTLPGKVQRALQQRGHSISCFAIGGIDEANCAIPIQFGCDGVAVIRSIMQSEMPHKTAKSITERLNAAWEQR